MATIVQPYNPWREQLALTALGNVAGNIIGDIWKTHRQNEQNRKANAFRGQLQQNLQNNAQPEISLIPKEAPQGYNSNPWANAFHQNNSPLTAFDIGTSTVGKTPSIQDIMRTADNLAATPRFSMLGQDVVQGAKNSLIQNTIANMFSNAGDIQGQMNALTMGAVTGSVVPQVLMAFSPFAAHMSPHKQAIETNLEDSKRIDIFDPLKGILTPGAAFKVGVSPNTAENNQTQRYVAAKNAEAHIGAAKINAGSAENVARIHALGDEARAQATVQAQQLQIWQEQYKALSDEIANDTANLAGLNEQDAIAMQSVINQKKQRLAQLEQLMLGAYSGTGSSQNSQGATTAQNPANSNNVWFGMVGNPKGISIHPHGTFGYDRGDHKHGGIDIIVAEGTDIRAMPEMGSSFIVRQAYKSNSYGNNIVIESDRKINGKSIKFRIAHMQDGSLNLKPGQTIKAGDIIGKVGSTGRSTGPHIHLEVMLDGHLVDPQTFFQQFPLDNTAQDNTTQSSSPQQQTQTQPTPQGQPDREVMRDKDGTVIYQSELDEMIREGAKKGLGPLGVKNGLRQKGFEDISEKRKVTTVAPALNWSPSYQKIPYSPIKIPKPANPPDLSWSWPSFDINKPILGGGQRQQPLPQTVPASDDKRFTPIMHSRVSALMPDLPNFSITSGDETAVIPDIFYDPTLDPAPNDPRFNALTPEDLQSVISARNALRRGRF